MAITWRQKTQNADTVAWYQCRNCDYFANESFCMKFEKSTQHHNWCEEWTQEGGKDDRS